MKKKKKHLTDIFDVWDRKRISRSTISDKTRWCLGQKADFKKYDFRQESLMLGTESEFQEVRFQTSLVDVRDRKRISRSTISDKTH